MVAALTALGEDELLFRDSVRRFAREQVAPYVREMDELGSFRKSILDQLFALGLMAIEIPEELGGQGGTFFQSLLAVEELSAVDPSVGIMVDVQNTIVLNALLRWADRSQKQRFLPRLARDTVGCYALSEAGSGSDAFALTTLATEQGDCFSLTGRKLWISNALEGGLFLVFATVNPEAGYRGITAFLADRATPGLTVGRKENKIGLRASSTCEVIFENCLIPKQNIVGEIGKGYKIAIETLNEGRIAIGAQMIGLARGALESAVAYAKQRKQFGAPIAHFQAVRFQLASLATELEAARLLVYNAARLREANRPFVAEAAMAKLYSSQIAEKTASEAIEIFGGIGITKDCPAEKFYRDAKIGRIYEGTTNVQMITIAKQLLGDTK